VIHEKNTIFLYFNLSRLALGSTQSTLQWILGGFFSESKAATAWSWSFTGK